MPLLLGDLQGHEDFMDAFAAIQNQFAKADGLGRWVPYAAKSEDFSIGGAGNSWVVPGLPDTLGRYLTYAVAGDTMTLNIYVPVSNLTAATTATAQIFVRIPGGYKAGGPSPTVASVGRIYSGYGFMTNGGTNYTARVKTQGGAQVVTIERTAGSNLANDTAFYVEGCITFQVVPL